MRDVFCLLILLLLLYAVFFSFFTKKRDIRKLEIRVSRLFL